MKFCIIRRVAFKWPGTKSRIVWAHVLAESEGLALVLVSNPHSSQPHSILIAQENFAQHVFESVGPYRFDLGTEDMKEAGAKLRSLGKSFSAAEFLKLFPPEDFE